MSMAAVSVAEETPAPPVAPRGNGRRRRALSVAVWIRGKLARVVPVLVIVTFATSAMVRLLPGDPARAFLGPDATEDQVAQLRDQLGLDDNVFVGYGKWIWQVLHGDLGTSYRTHDTVTSLLADRLPVSLELVFLAQVLALVVAIPIGVFTAHRAGGLLDRLWSALAYGGIAIPGFVLGLLLIFAFPVSLGLLQVSGYTPLRTSIPLNLQSLTLPMITLALTQVAVYSRLLRSDMIGTLQENYVSMAKAKGLPTRRILLGHALRPSSFSLMTLAGMNVGQLISGAVVVEFLFGLPGVGQLLVNAILTRDLPVLQGTILFIVLAYVVINMVIDALYTVVDPRVRGASAHG